jgi:hypothetical protein
MIDLKELVKQTQNNPTHKAWYQAVEGQALDYISWVACDHLEGKKANAAAMKRVLFNTFNITISTSSIKGWLQKVETGEVTYGRPKETG